MLVVLFLAAALSAAEVPPSDLDAPAKLQSELLAYVSRTTPDFQPRLERILARRRALSQRVNAREAAGHSTLCSHQILTEVGELSSGIADMPWLEKRLDDLEFVLAHPEEEAKAGRQDPTDGGWGACHDRWFFKVNATFDHLAKRSSANETPTYSFHLFDRVNSPEKLRAYFTSIAVSDIPKTGMDHRKELNESLANLMRLILRGKPVYYSWHPQLKAAITDLILHDLRNPATGWWGERYLRGGHEEFVDDLSITFHVISYLHGDVPSLDRTARHLLAVKDLEYPIGWRENGHPSNHHNMDVAVLLRYAWPQLDDSQKQLAASEIRKMMDYCLRQTLQPDGHFRADEGSTDAIEEANSWGVSFLSRVGYFDAKDRFWTSERFPEAAVIRQKLIAFIERHLATGGAGGSYYEDDLAVLKAAHPDQ